MPTYALLTCVLHEHAYMNAFISHYKNLGFRDFYILCDKHQPKYEPYLIGLENIKVIFIHMNYSLINKKSFDSIQNMYYYQIIKNMNYDWILLCDADEFLYLPSSSIQNYMNPLIQKYPNLAQISFPWMIVDSLKDDYSNMFDQLRENKWFTNHHVKSIFKKNRLHYSRNQLPITSHTSHVNGYTYVSRDYNNKSAFMIHFHTRSFKNNIIKILTNQYVGKSDQNQRSKLLKIIKNNSYNYKELTKFALIKAHQTKEIPHFELTGLNYNILPNNVQYNNDLFNQLITYYNLPLSYFDKIWENHEITISPTTTLYIKKEELNIKKEELNQITQN
jgi:hypothetical protein